MDNFERPPSLRTVNPIGDGIRTPANPAAPPPINPTTELVADLLSATGLLSPDKLALVRGRAAQGSFAQALVDEGVASGEGIARTRAASMC